MLQNASVTSYKQAMAPSMPDAVVLYSFTNAVHAVADGLKLYQVDPVQLLSQQEIPNLYLKTQSSFNWEKVKRITKVKRTTI